MKKKLVVIQQNDTHGCLDMHDELYWQGNGPVLKKAGGFARIAGYVKKEKAQHENVLFFDGGDLFHGTLPLVSSNGNALLPLLEKMELDGFVPGNWDYAYGKEQLLYLSGSLPFPVIACNVKDKERGEALFEPYIIKELHGLRIGIIGLTYPYVDKTMDESFSEGMAFSLGVEEVNEIVGRLKDEADLLILLSHMGLPLDAKLASMVTGIDVILSGHSHDRVVKPIAVGNTLIVQAGSSSSFVGRLELVLEEGRIESIDYRLVNISETMDEDEEVKEIVSSLLDPFQEQMDTAAGETETILHRMTLNEAPMDKLITDAYMYSYNCDLAFSHGWRYAPPLASGKLSLYDFHTIIPTNPKMFTLELEGRSLWDTLEKNLEMVFSADPFEQKGGYILRSSGLFMAYKPYNPKGHRIQTLLIGGKEIDFHKIYRIAGGGGQLFKGFSEQKVIDGVRSVDVIRSFLKNNGPFNPEGKPSIIGV